MSRLGKIPVELPKEVKIAITDNVLEVQGPKGKLSLDVADGIKIEQADQHLMVTRNANTKQIRSNHGTMRALLQNMIVGVTQGHKKELEIQGVGFRSQIKGTKLVINLGFSHPVEFEIPKDVKVAAPKQTELTVEGTNKTLVGQVAADIRKLKVPEPYKGKGIRYVGENVRRKQGKSVTK